MSNDRKMLQECVTWEKLGLELITASFHVDVFPHKTEIHFIWWSLLLELPYANKREYILVLKIVTVLRRERKTWIVGMVLFLHMIVTSHWVASGDAHHWKIPEITKAGKDMLVNPGIFFFFNFDPFFCVVQKQLVCMYWITLGNWTISGLAVVYIRCMAYFKFWAFLISI